MDTNIQYSLPFKVYSALSEFFFAVIYEMDMSNYTMLLRQVNDIIPCGG